MRLRGEKRLVSRDVDARHRVPVICNGDGWNAPILV
jgi:hypothetical protein